MVISVFTLADDDEHVGCDALAIFDSLSEPEPEIVPSDVPDHVIANLILALKLIDLVPSALCPIVIVLESNVLFPDPPILPEPLYLVPLIVIDQDFDAEDEILYGLCRVKTALTVEVLLATDVPVSVTDNVPYGLDPLFPNVIVAIYFSLFVILISNDPFVLGTICNILCVSSRVIFKS
jgi:hypothetical protein